MSERKERKKYEEGKETRNGTRKRREERGKLTMEAGGQIKGEKSNPKKGARNN